MAFSQCSHLSNPPISVQVYTRGLSSPSEASRSSPCSQSLWPLARKLVHSPPGGCQPARAPGCHPTALTPNRVSVFFPPRFIRPLTEPRPSSVSPGSAPSSFTELLEHPREAGCWGGHCGLLEQLTTAGDNRVSLNSWRGDGCGTTRAIAPDMQGRMSAFLCLQRFQGTAASASSVRRESEGVRVSALPRDDRCGTKRVHRPSLTAGVTATSKAQSGPAWHVAAQRSTSFLFPVDT